MKYQIISFYTLNTNYEKEITKLEASLNRFELSYHVFPCEPLGSWRKNLDYKSESILRAFDMFPDRDIVFIDADGVVRQYPVLFDTLSENREYDIAAHFHPYRGTNINGGSLLSGTLWFQNNEKGRILVKAWDDIGRNHSTIRHQHCLRLAINELKRQDVFIKLYRLPREYTLIFDYYRGKNRPKPVVEHFQASRKLRNEVGYGQRLLNSSFNTLEEKRRIDKKAERFIEMRKKKRSGMLTTRGIKANR